MSPIWPFVGRSEDVAALRAVLETRDDRGDGRRHGAGLLLRGPPGVGKTRLLAEFLDHARAQGVRVRYVRATPAAASVPLGCLSAVLQEDLGGIQPWPGPEVLFHEAVASLVREVNEHGPWLLAVDDVPSLDDASAGVFHQCLVATGAPLVGTARTDMALPGPFDSLWVSGELDIRTIGPLSDVALGELVDASFDAVLDGWSRHRLVQLAEGNPLTLRELVASVRDTGALAPTAHGLKLTDDFSRGQQVQALVSRRLALVRPSLRALLELVALGEPLDLAALLRLCDSEDIDEAVVSGLLAVADDGGRETVHSAHPLFAEALRAQLPPARRRRASRSLLQVLPDSDVVGSAHLRRALLHLEANVPADAELLASASVSARYAGDHELALRFADAALAVADRAGPSRAAGARAALIRSVVRVLRKEMSAVDAFPDAMSWAETDDEIATVVGEWTWAAMLSEGLSSSDAILGEGLRRTTSRLASMTIGSVEASMVGYAGRWSTARDKALSILDQMTPDDPAELRLTVEAVTAMAAAFHGPSRLAVEMGISAQRLFGLATQMNANQVVFGRGGHLYGIAEIEGFETAAARCRAFIHETLAGRAYLDFTGMWLGVIANQAVSMGVLTAQTLHECDEAIRFLRWRDPGGLCSFAIAARGAFAALAGDLAVADRYLDEYDSEWRAREFKTTVHADRGRAWSAFQRGDIDGALDWAERGWHASWERADVALWAIVAAHDLVRFGVPERAVDRVVAAAAQLDSPFSAALVAHTKALCDGDVGALCDAAAALRRLSSPALAAEALLQASQLAAPAHREALRGEARGLLSASLLRTPVVAELLGATPGGIGNGGAASNQDLRITLARRDRGWVLAYGPDTSMLRNLAGMSYLATLLANPGRPQRASVLAGGIDVTRLSLQPLLDDEARRALEQRGLEVARRLARARTGDSADRIAALEDEADALADELARSLVHHRESRAFADPDERARTAVRKAIVRAIDEIGVIHPPAAEHLRTRIVTGTTCVYNG